MERKKPETAGKERREKRKRRSCEVDGGEAERELQEKRRWGRSQEGGKEDQGKREVRIRQVRGSAIETLKHTHRGGFGIPGQSLRAPSTGRPRCAPYRNPKPPLTSHFLPLVLTLQVAVSVCLAEVDRSQPGKIKSRAAGGLKHREQPQPQQPPEAGEGGPQATELGSQAETTSTHFRSQFSA